MIKISKDSFNDDLDEYLSKRLRAEDEGSFFDGFRERFSGLFANFMIRKEKVVIDDEGNEVGSKRRWFFSRRNDDYEEEFDEEVEETVSSDIDDLKEAVKVLHRWLEKLPPEKIAEFKKSPDFETYKGALRKLGMIKE